MRKQYFELLLEKYIQGTISPEEWQELDLLFHAGYHDADLEMLIDDKLKDTSLHKVPPVATGDIIFQRITEAKKNADSPEVGQPVKTIRQTGRLRWWMAAAIIIMAVSAGLAFYVHRSSANNSSLALLKNAGRRNDAAPPSANKAIITLAGGRKIVLDSAGNGMLAIEGDANVEKKNDGQIVYSSGNKKITGHDDQDYNTIDVPRGSRVVAITLEDGTNVWLNAASSMHYPVAFNGKERKVKVSGEAYFEVAKDKSRKFVVETQNLVTEVYGTHFNVRAHDDEASSRVTLLEGSVRVSGAGNSRMLHPGEQAAFSEGGDIAVDTVDIEQVIAWKEGRFQFEGSDIKEVMRELARWYNLETVYEGVPVLQHFSGSISRNVEASRVLKMLEATDAVHFRMADKKITVTP